MESFVCLVFPSNSVSTTMNNHRSILFAGVPHAVQHRSQFQQSKENQRPLRSSLVVVRDVTISSIMQGPSRETSFNLLARSTFSLKSYAPLDSLSCIVNSITTSKVIWQI